MEPRIYTGTGDIYMEPGIYTGTGDIYRNRGYIHGRDGGNGTLSRSSHIITWY